MRKLLLVILCCTPFLVAFQQAPSNCRDMRINAKGSSGAAITVSTSVVAIADRNYSRCGLTIINETANPARCAETTGAYTLTPSSTVGMFVPANATVSIGDASKQAWSCIRQGASDATLSVVEELPGS